MGQSVTVRKSPENRARQLIPAIPHNDVRPMTGPFPQYTRFYAAGPPRTPRFRQQPSLATLVGLVILLLITARLMLKSRSPEVVPPAGIHVHVERVIDGDTLLLDSGHRVRLLGVDTPETKHPDRPPELFGPEASEFTRALVEGRDVLLEYDRERLDQYRRILAYVHVDGQLLNTRIIEAGFSRAETRFPYRADRKKEFQKAEAAARAQRRGLWSAGGQRTKTSDDSPTATGDNP